MKTELINFRLPQDIAAALKRAASEDLRSINAQGVFYLRMGLLADGRYQPGTASTAPAGQDAALPVAVPVAAVPPPVPAPTPVPQDTGGPDVHVIAAIAAMVAEVRHEQHRTIASTSHTTLRRILSTRMFSDVSDLPTARAKGLAAWIAAGASPGLVSYLFPGDGAAIAQAKQRKSQAYIQPQRALGPELGQFIAEKGILGKGSTSLRNVLTHFDGMSIAEAVRQGAAAWLDAGVSEDVARKIFDERTALEAKRRAIARGYSRKKQLKLESAASHIERPAGLRVTRLS